MIYEFRFWKEWIDEQGRMWAEPYVFDSAGDARSAHKGALGWLWAGNRARPSVTDLYSVAFAEDPATGKKREHSRTVICDGGVREYYEATLSGVRPSGGRFEVSDTPGTSRAAAKPDSFDTPF